MRLTTGVSLITPVANPAEVLVGWVAEATVVNWIHEVMAKPSGPTTTSCSPGSSPDPVAVKHTATTLTLVPAGQRSSSSFWSSTLPTWFRGFSDSAAVSPV